MTLKQSAAILLSVSILTGAAGCADSSSSSADHTEAVTVSSADSQAESTTVTAEQTDAEPGQITTRSTTVTLPASHQAELLHRFTGFSTDGQINSIVPAGGTTAAVSMRSGRCCLIDLNGDRVLREITLSSDYEQVIGVRKSGEIIAKQMRDGNSSLVFYAPETGEPRQAEYSGSCWQFVYDRESDVIYSFDERHLYRVSDDGSETPVYQFSESDPASTGICGAAPEHGVLYRTIRDTDSFSGISGILLSLDGRKEYCRVPDTVSNYGLTAAGFVSMEVRSDGTDGNFCNCAVYDTGTGKRLRTFGANDDPMPALIADPDSRYFMINSQNALLLADPETGKTEQLAISETEAAFCTPCYLPDLGMWLCAVTNLFDENSPSSLYVIDPSQAAFRSDAQPPYLFGTAAAASLSPNAADERALADEIERKYGIRILIGNEILQYTDCYYRLVSTDDTSDPHYNKELYDTVLKDELQVLDRELSRYPEGFFDLFRSDNLNGLSIGLAADLLAPDGPDKSGPAGITFQGLNRINICFSHAELNDMMKGTLHHEMFHAVEFAMEARGKLFDEDEWNQLNPKGFDYIGLNTVPSPDLSKYTLENSEAKDLVYFNKTYGCSNSQEDRATIAECCFATFYQNGNPNDKRDGYQAIQEYPHLKAKLDRIGAALTECFGTDYLRQIAEAGKLIG